MQDSASQIIDGFWETEMGFIVSDIVCLVFSQAIVQTNAHALVTARWENIHKNFSQYNHPNITKKFTACAINMND